MYKRQHQLHIFTEFGSTVLCRTRLRYAERKYRRFRSRPKLSAGGRKLPAGWRRLSRLRDVMNPLQLLGTPGHTPRRDQDLIRLVEDTVRFFEKEDEA